MTKGTKQARQARPPIAPSYPNEPAVYGVIPPGEPPGPVMAAVRAIRDRGLLVRCTPTDSPLTLVNVLLEAGEIQVSMGRHVEQFLSVRKAGRAQRPGRRTPVMEKRAARYAEIKRAHPGRSDEAIASEIAKEWDEADGGALKRLKRALNRKP